MSIDKKGSCFCSRGYYLTEQGCRNCEQLIPNCTQCYLSMSDSGIPLYNGANVSGDYSRKYFVECRNCGYNNFKKSPDFVKKTPTQCPACAGLWEGCGYCGAYGSRCQRCLPSHIFQSPYNHLEPCRACSKYMGGCIWCRNKTQCVEYADGRRLL